MVIIQGKKLHADTEVNPVLYDPTAMFMVARVTTTKPCVPVTCVITVDILVLIYVINIEKSV